MRTFLLCFSLIFIAAQVAICQDIDEDYLTVLLQEEEENTSMAFKPVIGIGGGCFSFYGDVNDYYRTPINGLSNVRISIGRNISKYFDIEFHGTAGNVTGSRYNGQVGDSLNFRTQVFAGGVSLNYNFNHLLERKRPIHPYLSLGVEIFQFSPKADWISANGDRYHYWSDGTIRDVEEGIGKDGRIISKDNKYETDLRNMDLYGYGEYSKTSVAIPVDLGLNITVSDRVTCRFGTAFHLPMTDYIDNVKGNTGIWKKDVVLNTYISLTFDLFSPADEIAAVETFRNLKFTITDRLDEDGDGVDDFNDECPGTPAKVKVTYKGCPNDEDKDGVPDYLDKQKDTPSGKVIVGANGIKMTDAQVISLLYDPDAVKRNEVKIYSKTTQAKTNDGKTEIPAKFKAVDLNEDKYISHDELQKAIDSIFDGTSNLTPADINELHDFFFNQ
jgi:hypothetical protein